MLNQFPVSSQLGFLKASKLNFRITRGKRGLYQEIRIYSSVSMHGFLDFLTAPGVFSDTIYNKLRLQVSISNFPNSSKMDFQRTITPGAGSGGGFNDVISLVFTPSEAQHLANLAAVDGLPSVVTTKTATSMTQTFTPHAGGLGWVQQWDLSNLLADPDGHGKSIRAWQHLMINNLAALRGIVNAAMAGPFSPGLSVEDFWDVVWTIQDNGSNFNNPGVHVIDFSGGLVSAHPPTGNLPAITGKILQIQRGVNAAGDPIFIDLLGVEGGDYYPGQKVQNRAYVWPTYLGDATGRLPGLIPSYNLPDLVYETFEQLYCSEVRHRIHHSPVFSILDNKTLLSSAGGGFGPDTYYGAGIPDTILPVDEFGRVQFDTLCPANVVVGFFADPDQPDLYWVTQIYEKDPATNINGFVIPP